VKESDYPQLKEMAQDKQDGVDENAKLVEQNTTE